VPLLEKVGRGVVVTEAGRLLAEQAQDLLSRMEQLTALVQAGHDRPTGTLRIAAFATAVRGLVADALARIGAQAPQLETRLVELDPWQSIDALTAGQVDLAIVHTWEPLPIDVPAHVAEQRLGTDRADVLLPRDHPLAGRTRLGAAALAEERWVGVGRGSICDQWLTTMLRGVGAEPRIVHRSPEFLNHLELVRAGVAVALVPRLGRPPLPADVVAVPVRNPVPLRTVSVVWRRTMTTGPALRLALDVTALAADRLQRPEPTQRKRVPAR
jgi:DNA-binding transcriptional LysR family regulator